VKQSTREILLMKNRLENNLLECNINDAKTLKHQNDKKYEIQTQMIFAF